MILEKKSPKYVNMLSSEYIGCNTTEFIEIFNSPNSINSVGQNEVWSYGPSMQDLRRKKSGDLIGVSVMFSKEGKLIRCDGIYKD